MKQNFQEALFFSAFQNTEAIAKMKPRGLLKISAILLGLTLFSVQSSYGAKILSLNFMFGKSHKITYDPLMSELARRGHEVTVVSPVPSNSNSTNPKEILAVNFQKMMDAFPDMYETKIKEEKPNPSIMFNVFADVCRDTYALPHIQEILNQKYDLVIHEPFFSECVAGALHKLNTSVILYTTFSAPSDLVRILGGPSPPSFIPNIFAPFDNKMDFVERFQNFLYELSITLIKEFYYNPGMEALYREALNDSTLPGVSEVLKNASLILSNSHFCMGGARPFMPDVIEVGGMHMRKAKALPKDLEEFAQSSGEHGFIYFSMGSVLQGSNMPETHRNTLLNAFSKLKQKVLWKWETESMPDLPPNVKLIKWAPQQDILGHSKIKAFITHGGLGSTTEAVFHGVPLLGIPMFGDQLTNIEKFTRQGIARRVEFVEMTEEAILEALKDLIDNPNRYSENVKKMSSIFRDQRDDPLERAVYWVEYVLRHNGAVHLRSPARELNFLQYHSLDVISVLLTILTLAAAVFYQTVRFTICFIKRCLFGKPITKELKKKTN